MFVLLLGQYEYESAWSHNISQYIYFGTYLFALISGWTYLPAKRWNASQRAASAKDSTKTSYSSFHNPRSWHYIGYPCISVWAPLQVCPDVLEIRKHNKKEGKKFLGWTVPSLVPAGCWLVYFSLQSIILADLCFLFKFVSPYSLRAF